MRILGLSFFYHDAAAALLVDGRPVAMAEEERFSRKKHDAGFPELAINFVLQEGDSTPHDLDWVIFYEKPFIKFDRVIKTSLTTFPFAPQTFALGMKSIFGSKLWIRGLIAERLNISPEKILFSEHHLSHAASAFLCSPFERAAILTIDGVGEWACATIGLGEGDKITLLKEIRFPHSLGLLYSAFTAFLGFEVNEGEYKVMGMAPYGTPRYADQIRKLITFFDDGSFALNLDYFSFYRSHETTYSRRFIKLFGAPRDPQSKFFTRATGWPSYFGQQPQKDDLKRLAAKQERYADIAASVQLILEEAVVRLAHTAHELTNAPQLCLAGGVALNSVANWKIIEQTPFREIFIQPAAGDGGAALGAALALHQTLVPDSKRWLFEHAAHGKAYSDSDISSWIAHEGIKDAERLEDETLFQKVTEALIAGKVIGWFDGRFEWGPRALGQRSIIADPRRADMKDIVNTKIKFREPYRPFAPSVLAEHAEEFFELPNAQNHFPARFMLYVVPVKKEKRDVIPAVTHVDGTARPQLVFRETTPRYYRLIKTFYQTTGVPLVLNTSFNLKGEPIVASPADAYRTFMKSEMDLLVLGNTVIRKH